MALSFTTLVESIYVVNGIAIIELCKWFSPTWVMYSTNRNSPSVASVITAKDLLEVEIKQDV